MPNAAAGDLRPRRAGRTERQPRGSAKRGAAGSGRTASVLEIRTGCACVPARTRRADAGRQSGRRGSPCRSPRSLRAGGRKASRSDALFKGGAREAPRSPQPMQLFRGCRGCRGSWGWRGWRGSGRVGALSPRLSVPFAGANWSRRRKGRPQAAVLGSSPKGRRSEVAAPNVIRRPACGGRAGPLRTAPSHGCVSLIAKTARR